MEFSLTVRHRFHKNYVLFLINRIIEDLTIIRSRVQSIIREPFFPEPPSTLPRARLGNLSMTRFLETDGSFPQIFQPIISNSNRGHIFTSINVTVSRKAKKENS